MVEHILHMFVQESCEIKLKRAVSGMCAMFFGTTCEISLKREIVCDVAAENRTNMNQIKILEGVSSTKISQECDFKRISALFFPSGTQFF